MRIFDQINLLLDIEHYSMNTKQKEFLLHMLNIGCLDVDNKVTVQYILNNILSLNYDSSFVINTELLIILTTVIVT